MIRYLVLEKGDSLVDTMKFYGGFDDLHETLHSASLELKDITEHDDNKAVKIIKLTYEVIND